MVPCQLALWPRDSRLVRPGRPRFSWRSPARLASAQALSTRCRGPCQWGQHKSRGVPGPQAPLRQNLPTTGHRCPSSSGRTRGLGEARVPPLARSMTTAQTRPFPPCPKTRPRFRGETVWLHARRGPSESGATPPCVPAPAGSHPDSPPSEAHALPPHFTLGVAAGAASPDPSHARSPRPRGAVPAEAGPPHGRRRDPRAECQMRPSHPNSWGAATLPRWDSGPRG